MEYSEFARKAVLKDRRNIFSEFNGDLDCVPDTFREFYQKNNPEDVELNFVKFVSASKLTSLQAEYSYLNAQFVFAVCNGDPIFMNEGHIYTAPHGVNAPKWELLADDIKSYLSYLFTE